MNRSTISPTLWESYKRTSYVVQADQGEIVIHIGETNSTLDALVQRYDVNDWAFITAYNPYSQQLSDTENHCRQQQFRQAVQELGAACLEGRGQGDDGTWPAEPSLFILGISETKATRLGQSYGQNAIVIGSVGFPARLALCFPEKCTQ